MTTFTFRSLAFAASLAALITASASADSQPTYKHITGYTARVDAPAPAAATVSHGRGAPTEEIFSRNAEDCNKKLCFGN